MAIYLVLVIKFGGVKKKRKKQSGMVTYPSLRLSCLGNMSRNVPDQILEGEGKDYRLHDIIRYNTTF